ncbi:MAG: hypothetical protein U0235_04400 [Polyangiaceae bacterium]
MSSLEPASAQAGWTLGVGITSVILAFAMFKVLSQFKLSTEMSLLENNAMQSIATSAGYMTAPLITSVGAYMMVTNQVLDALGHGVDRRHQHPGRALRVPAQSASISIEQLHFPGSCRRRRHGGPPLGRCLRWSLQGEDPRRHRVHLEPGGRDEERGDHGKWLAFLTIPEYSTAGST